MTTPQPLIQVRNLGKSYGKSIALTGISFDVAPGEILAVIGTNGAGKTTLLHLLAGLLFATDGEVTVDGLDRWKQNFDVRQFTTFVPANALVVGSTSNPFDYLQFMGQIYGIDPAVVRDRVDAMSKEMHYTQELKKNWSTLSLGHGKKALLMGAFLPEAKLRILDEPFAGGIDPPGMETLYSWMERARTCGETVLFSTQVLDQAEDFADRLLLLNRGQITFLGTPPELLERAGVSPGTPRALAKAFMNLADSRP